MRFAGYALTAFGLAPVVFCFFVPILAVVAFGALGLALSFKLEKHA